MQAHRPQEHHQPHQQGCKRRFMAKTKTAEKHVTGPQTNVHSAPHKPFNQVSQKRAGNPHVMDSGRPGSAGEKPVNVKKSGGFGSDGDRRKGNNHVPSTGHPGAAGESPVTCGDCSM